VLQGKVTKVRVAFKVKKILLGRFVDSNQQAILEILHKMKDSPLQHSIAVYANKQVLFSGSLLPF